MSIPNRVLICGDRNWGGERDEALFAQAMLTWTQKFGMPAVIIEGCARGADQMAGHWWAVNAIVPVEHFPAKWEEHDSYGQTCWCADKTSTRCRGAGPIRNLAMLRDGKPDAVIAFHRDLASSRGTKHMVTAARTEGIPVWIPVRQPEDA